MKNTSEVHKDNQSLVFDVVCGMELTPREVKYTHEFHNEVYYFCTKTCLEHFRNNPEQYLGGEV